MTTSRPRLYLHIGRNKAGSTTLQAYCLDHADRLRQEGIRYALFGYPSPPGGDVPTFPSHDLLGEFVRAQRTDAVLVSHEGICCFPAALSQAMATDLSDLDVQVIFYTRPYRDWVVSSYKYDVRIGFNGRDFDRYLDSIWPRISVWPMLEIWGETVGWENMRVRSTHPDDLLEGDLLSDFLAAINVPRPSVATAERLNNSASWVAVELMRTVLGRDRALGWTAAELAVAQVLHHCADQAVSEHGGLLPDAVYLTRRQAQDLTRLYNHDLATLAARTGVSLRCDDAQDAPERAFLPSVAQAPKAILQSIRDQATGPAAALHPQVAEFVNRPAFAACFET